MWRDNNDQLAYLATTTKLTKRRRLKLRRYLVIPDDIEFETPTFAEIDGIAATMAKAGVEVLAIERSKIATRPGEHKWSEDVVIADESVGLLYELSNGGDETFGVVTVSTHPKDLENYKERFIRLSRARPWVDVVGELRDAATQPRPTSLRHHLTDPGQGLGSSPTFYDSDPDRYDHMSFDEGRPAALVPFVEDERRHVLAFLQSATGEGAPTVVFDFGCGTGFYLGQFLTEIGPGWAGRIVAIDISHSMTGAAARRLAQLDHAAKEIVTGDIRTHRTALRPGETPVGICTYNTIGVVDDLKGLIDAMCLQCAGGHLLISSFRGESFGRSAKGLYDAWAGFVGSPRLSRFDNVRRTFSNSGTGFHSRWVTQNEVLDVLRRHENAVVTAGERGLRNFVEVDLTAIQQT